MQPTLSSLGYMLINDIDLARIGITLFMRGRELFLESLIAGTASLVVSSGLRLRYTSKGLSSGRLRSFLS